MTTKALPASGLPVHPPHRESKVASATFLAWQHQWAGHSTLHAEAPTCQRQGMPDSGSEHQPQGRRKRNMPGADCEIARWRPKRSIGSIHTSQLNPGADGYQRTAGKRLRKLHSPRSISSLVAWASSPPEPITQQHLASRAHACPESARRRAPPEDPARSIGFPGHWRSISARKKCSAKGAAGCAG